MGPFHVCPENGLALRQLVIDRSVFGPKDSRLERQEADMKFQLEIDEHHNFVRAEIAGRCSFIDFGRLFVRLLDLKAEPGLKILTDIREAELSEGDFNGVSTVESRADQFIDAYLPVKQAILVNSMLNFGIARMYEALAEKDGYEVHIFRDEEAAKEWLCTAAP